MKPTRSETTDELVKRRSRKRATWLSVGFLAAVAVVFWALDGMLLIDLRMAANEAYADRTYPVLSVDAVNQLNDVSAKRIARFLSFPSTQIRTVACMALALRRGDRDPNSWIGVAPALLRAYRESEEDYERARIVHTIALLPLVSAEDVEAVFGFAEEVIVESKPDWRVAGSLLETLANTHPSSKQRALDAYVRSFPKTTDLERKESLQRIMRLAPNSPEALEAIRWAASERILSRHSGVDELFHRNPALLDSLLDGTPAQQLTVFQIFTHDILLPQSPNQAAINRWLRTPARLEVVMLRAKAFLDPKAPLDGDAEIDAAFGVVHRADDGPTLLMEAAKKTTGKRRARTLKWANDSARRLKPPAGEQLLTPYVSTVLRWMLEGDSDVTYAAIRWIDDYREPTWYVAQRAGPDSPVVNAFRKLLEQNKEGHEYSALSAIDESCPAIDARDVDRIAAALDRAMVMMKKNFERTGVRPQGLIDPVHERLFTKLKNHAHRPAAKKVLELRQQLLDEGIVTKPRSK